MATTPFDIIPRKLFVARMMVPCAFVFFFSFLAMGVITQKPVVNRMTSSDSVSTFQISPFETAVVNYSTFLGSVFHLPGVCITGRTVNEFQSKQCMDFSEKIAKGALYCSLPFLGVLFFYFLLFDLLRTLYKRAGKRIATGEALFGGTVTNPAEAPLDFLCWFFCLRPIGIQKQNKEQIRIYIPRESVIPRPGQTMAVFSVGRFFGKKRYVAVLYTPHVAVFSGG